MARTQSSAIRAMINSLRYLPTMMDTARVELAFKALVPPKVAQTGTSRQIHCL